MNKTYFALGGILAALVLFLVLGAAPPAPVQRNQFTTNVPGAVVLGLVAFDGAVNIAGASTHGATATFTNGTVNQGSAKITGDLYLGGTEIVTNIVQANNLVLTNNGSLGFATNLTAPDTFLVRDNAPNRLAVRNGVNAQEFRIYNTYTDSGNYNRLSFSSDANGWYMTPDALGTSGAAKDIYIGQGQNSLYFRSASLLRWQLNSSGNLVCFADATYTIGATNASRPSILYLSRGLVIGPNSGGGFITNILTARAILDFPSTAASSSSDLSIAVTGATTNDVATVQAPPIVQLANSTWTCFASNDTVYVRFSNVQTVGALDPGPASFSVKVDRF